MVEFLVTLLLVAVVIYVINLVIGMLSLPAQAKTIAYIIIGVLFLLWLLDFLGLYSSGMNFPR